MGVPYYGDFAEDDTVIIPFNTFSSDDPSASVTMTTLVDADIKVHKDGNTTAIATDGATIVINFNSQTGAHQITIDTNAHSDYATGSEYAVLIEGATVDGGNVTAWVGTFSIERAGGALARLETLITTVGAAGVGLTAITDNTDEIGALGVGLTTCATATGFATPTNITSASGVVLHGDYDAAKTAAPASEYDTEMGRITGNVALASVVGALADVTAAGDPTEADTLMQYIKQLINTIDGTIGIASLRAAAAPANNVSLAEMIRAIWDDTNNLQTSQGDWATATGFATPTNVTDAHATTDAACATATGFSVPSEYDSVIADLQTDLDELTDAGTLSGVRLALMVDRIYVRENHEVNVDDAGGTPGAYEIRNAADNGNVATGRITDDDTTTQQQKVTWA